jgi:HSP20 family protein
MAEQELQPKEKESALAKSEGIRPGKVFLPPVDIYETEESIVVLADMPGVPADKVTIDVKDGQLTISGEIAPPQGDQEHLLVQEYDTGNFSRDFTLGQLVDQNRIEAAMKDGVLRLTLPKVEKAKPRKIEIKTL